MAIGEIRKDIPISNQVKAFLNPAFLLDHGFNYTPGLIIAGSLHVGAFFLILATVRTMNISKLTATEYRAVQHRAGHPLPGYRD